MKAARGGPFRRIRDAGPEVGTRQAMAHCRGSQDNPHVREDEIAPASISAWFVPGMAVAPGPPQRAALTGVSHHWRCRRRPTFQIAVRGGGYNVGGNAVRDGGLMIDLPPCLGGTSIRAVALRGPGWCDPGGLQP